MKLKEEASLDPVLQQRLDDMVKKVEDDLQGVCDTYKKEVEAALDELETQVASIEAAPIPSEPEPETPEPEATPSEPEPEPEARGETERSSSPGPVPSSGPAPIPSSGPAPSSKWQGTWHGPTLSQDDEMHPDDYYKKYGKNEPSWRKTFRYQGLTGLAKRLWRGTNPMQDIAWRYAHDESIRGLPTLQEYLEFKKIADYYINKYFPLNEAIDPRIAKALEEAKEKIRKSLEDFIFRIHTYGKGVRIAATQLITDFLNEKKPDAAPVPGNIEDIAGKEVEGPPKRGKKKEEGEKKDKTQEIEASKVQVAEALVPNVYGKLKSVGLDLTKWFHWPQRSNASFDSLRLRMNVEGFKKLTASADGLIELVAFLKVQNQDPEEAKNYISKVLTGKKYIDTENVLERAINKAALPATEVQARIQTKYEELKRRIPHPIEFEAKSDVKSDVKSEPKAEVPKAEVPKAEAPKADAPKAEAPTPATEAPAITRPDITSQLDSEIDYFG